MRISCELEIFLRDMMRVAAYFDVRSIRFVGSRQRIRASPIVGRPAAHPFILTWSHCYFPISIRLSAQLRDHFGRKLFRFLSRTGAIQAFASLEWADLIAPEARTQTIVSIPIPCKFPSRAPPSRPRPDDVLFPARLV
jgi:hypothetical protein